MLHKEINALEYIYNSDFSILQNYFNGSDIFTCENITNIKNLESVYLLKMDELINFRDQQRIKKYLRKKIKINKIYCKHTNITYDIFTNDKENIEHKKNIKNLFMFVNDTIYKNIHFFAISQHDINFNDIHTNYESLENLVIYTNDSSLILNNLPYTLKSIKIYMTTYFFNNDFSFQEQFYDFYEYQWFKKDIYCIDKKIDETNIKIKLPFGCVYHLENCTFTPLKI
jgi:hypothetical protein